MIAYYGLGSLAPVKRMIRAVLVDLGIPKDVFQFVNWPTRYDNREAMKALKGSGIAVPQLDSYAAKLWDYWERNLDPDLVYSIDHPTELSLLRRNVAGYAARTGLSALLCDDFVLAVTEIASNAIEHGVPPAVVQLWTTSTSVICQITDTGWHTQPLAGLLPPPSTQRRGRGLWMAHQLCDQFYLWPHPTTVRLLMDRS